MYNIIRIHTPLVALPDNAIRVSTLNTIPVELRGAIQIINCMIRLHNDNGPQLVPSGSIIAYEKSEKTPSGYNCWAVAGPHTNVVKIDEALYIEPSIVHAMLIPDKEDIKPLWVNRCNLTYNGDGTTTLKNGIHSTTGRIGIDFIIASGMVGSPNFKPSILTRENPSYSDYLVCEESGKDIGKLCELYPA